MKSLKRFLAEQDDIPIIHRSEDGRHETYVTKSLDNKETRDMINVFLLQATYGEWSNPYAVITRVAKVLATYGIQMPKAYLPDVTGGELVFGITPHGQLHDYNQNIPTDDNVTKYFLYFEYGVSPSGAFLCFAQVTDLEGLDELMEDVEEDGGVLEEESKEKTPEEYSKLLSDHGYKHLGSQKGHLAGGSIHSWEKGHHGVDVHTMYHKGAPLASIHGNHSWNHYHDGKYVKDGLGHKTLSKHLGSLSEDVLEEARLIQTHTNEAGDSAKVYGKNEYGEHTVKFHKGKTHIKNADYHTNDLEDAHATAKYQLKRGVQNTNEDVSEDADRYHTGYMADQHRSIANEHNIQGDKHYATAGKALQINKLDVNKAHNMAALHHYQARDAHEAVSKQFAAGVKAHDDSQAANNLSRKAYTSSSTAHNSVNEDLEIDEEVELLDEGYKVGDKVNVTNHKASAQYKITGKTKTHYQLQHDTDKEPRGWFPKERIARVNKAAHAHRQGKEYIHPRNQPRNVKKDRTDQHGNILKRPAIKHNSNRLD